MKKILLVVLLFICACGPVEKHDYDITLLSGETITVSYEICYRDVAGIGEEEPANGFIVVCKNTGEEGSTYLATSLVKR